jgi:hypothetical protein
MQQHDYGVITLAIPKDYKKAIALALTLNEHSPGLPISIAVPAHVRPLLEPYKHLFDKIITQRAELKGFEQKLYLDEYSPYQKTFFFDADILILKDIRPIIEKWSGSDYAARGQLTKGGVSAFGLDRQFVLNLIGKKSFSKIDGAGHAYFEKPGCQRVFDKAREVLSEYHKYQAEKFADEDAVGIAMTMLDIAPKKNDGFLGSPWCAINNSFKIDTDNSSCSYDDLVDGYVEPCAIHFPILAQPIVYARELRKTYKRNGIKVNGIWGQAFKEYVRINVYYPLASMRRKILNYFHSQKR